MKIRIKNGDYHINVKVKLASMYSLINQPELERLARNCTRGFLKPNNFKLNSIDYIGPVGMTLAERISRPISKFDFFFIIEQIIDNCFKLRKYQLPWNKVVWDLHNSFINDATKELNLIYLPLQVVDPDCGNVMSFIETLTNSSHPEAGGDTNFAMQFSYFLRSLDGYNPQKIEDYIKQVEPNAVSIIRNQRTNSSGFITDKRIDYINHYGQVPNDSISNHSNLLDDDSTGLLNENDFNDNNMNFSFPDPDATGLLEENTNSFSGMNFSDDDPTGLLIDDFDNGTMVLYDLDDGSAATSLLVETSINYPSLLRVLTNEIVNVDKQVYRIGKERQYVDYFVANNSAVSRSHADIITRDNRYFVKDLNSTNKTYINGQKLQPQMETEIFDNDRLKLANEEFIFRV